jgi:hypothetical protein
MVSRLLNLRTLSIFQRNVEFFGDKGYLNDDIVEEMLRSLPQLEDVEIVSKSLGASRRDVQREYCKERGITIMLWDED